MKTINLNIDKLGNITIDLDLKDLLLEETKKPKQLFYEILKDNFKKPKLTKKIFSKIDKKDLKNIGMLIIEANNLKEFYKDYKGKSFYYNFKMTLLKSKKSIEKNKLIIDVSNLNKNELDKILNELEKRLEKALEEANKVSKILSDYFKESAQQYFEKIGPNGENIVEILAEKNWVFPYDSPSYKASLIIDFYENKQYDKIDNLMLDLVKKEDLENFTNKWFNLKYFRKRENILKAGIKAHIDGNYELSIYTLLPHIEGVIWDFLIDLEDKDKLNNITNSPIKKFEYLGNYYEENIRNGFMIKSFFEKIISEKFPLYKSEDFLNISEEYDQINRHILSHGIVTKCISEINSLKLIYILDFLWQIIHIKEKENQKYY